MASTLPSIQSTFGWFFINAVVSSMLYGASIIQLYTYCDRFWKREAWQLKGAVVFAVLVDTVHQVLIIRPAYVLLVTDFGAYTKLLVIQMDFKVATVLTGITIVVAQGIFIGKAYILSDRNKILTGALSLLVAGEFTSIMIYSVHLFKSEFITELATTYALGVEKSMNVLCLVADSSLAASLIALLHRRKSAFDTTNSVVKRVTQFIIGTSLITVGFAIMALACNLAWPYSFSYIALDLLVAKCYVNCMFVSLNARSGLQKKLAGSADAVSIHLSNLSSSDTEAAIAIEYRK